MESNWCLKIDDEFLLQQFQPTENRDKITVLTERYANRKTSSTLSGLPFSNAKGGIISGRAWFGERHTVEPYLHEHHLYEYSSVTNVLQVLASRQ